MDKINLKYIGAKELTRKLAECQHPEDVAELISGLIEDDLRTAKFYMDKYKNSDSTDLVELKQEMESLEQLVKKLKEVPW